MRNWAWVPTANASASAIFTVLFLQQWVASLGSPEGEGRLWWREVGAVLTRSATSVVFLTATPVQNKLEDLWNLLKLLSPEEFSEWPLFQDQVKGNRLILAAQTALADHPPDYEAATQAVESFIQKYAPERAGRQFLATILERLANATPDRRECLELQADISRLSSTSHIISRTRKGEALPNRPKRDPHWQRVRLTEQERAIYDGVEDICRRRAPTGVEGNDLIL